MRWASGNWPNRDAVTGSMFSRRELLDMLHVRHMTFRAMPETVRELIDAKRIIPTAEMHDILFHFLALGRFFDEDTLFHEEETGETKRSYQTVRSTQAPVGETGRRSRRTTIRPR